MNPEIEQLKKEVEELKKKLENIPQFFGKRFTNALASPNFISGSSGWRIQDNGDVEFNSGTFRGDLLVGDDIMADSLILNDPNLSLAADNSWRSDEWQINLTMGNVIASTSNTVTNKVPIKINGTQYFLLATTSGSPSSISPSVSPSSSKSPSASPSVSPS